MGENMRFGLILGRLAILKIKFWANSEQLLKAVFSCFQGQKIFMIFLKNIVAVALKSYICNISLKKFIFG